MQAEIYVLKKEEGGRHTPVVSGYKPQFFFKTTSVTGTIQTEVDVLLPGDKATVGIQLDKPVAVEVGHNFAIREGGKTVGSGVVSKFE